MPVTLVSNISRHSSSDISATGLNTPTPALLTSDVDAAERGGRCCAMAASICAASRTSARSGIDAPARPSSASASCHGGAQARRQLRAGHRDGRALAGAAAAPTARPMPREPPVTTATLPESELSIAA